MIKVRTLRSFDAEDINRFVGGYTSTAKYIVNKTETHEQTVITLKLISLDQPYVKHWPSDDAELERYKQFVQQRLSLGAYDGSRLVGIAIAERRDWNRSLWVWEFGVAETHRRMGIGSRLMEAVTDKAREAGLRIIFARLKILMYLPFNSIARLVLKSKGLIFPTTPIAIW